MRQLLDHVKNWAVSYINAINLLRMKNSDFHKCLRELEEASNLIYEEENRKNKDAPGGLSRHAIEKLKNDKEMLENQRNILKGEY